MKQILILTIAILFFGFTGCTQTPTVKTIQTTPNNQLKPEWLSVPFDSSITALPSNFWGHSIIEIYNNLSIKLKEKGEQQTNAESLNQPIFGTILHNSTLAFRGELYLTKLQYNSASQLLNIKIKTVEKQKSGSEKDATILFVTINRQGVEHFIDESARDIKDGKS